MEDKNEVIEKKKLDLGSVAESAGKGMKSLFTKAKDGIVKVIDQNDDGSFDAEDVSVIADALSDVAKNTAVTVKETLEEQKRELERRTLQPIFVEDLDDANFMIPKLIRITEMDKKRQESEVCQGSIGYYSSFNDLKVVNIYKNYVDLLGLEFYPDSECEVYYVDPSDRGKYIAMQKYFNYLKIARIAELKKIAQDLGAKYFKVTYKEKEAIWSSKKFNHQAKGKANRDSASVSAEHSSSADLYATIEIAAENEFEGHEPKEPKLHYLKRDISIQSLIAMRFDENSGMKREKFVIEFSESSGLKVNDAVKIDAALKALNVSGDTSIVSEVKREARKFFEYEIEF